MARGLGGAAGRVKRRRYRRAARPVCDGMPTLRRIAPQRFAGVAVTPSVVISGVEFRRGRAFADPVQLG
jgi:hypothetical protein